MDRGDVSSNTRKLQSPVNSTSLIPTIQSKPVHLDANTYFYNHERIQIKTGVASLTLRHSA